MLEDYQISDFLTKPFGGNAKLVFAIRNALEKAQLHRSLKSLNLELERRVDERTLELQYAKDFAEAENNAKSQFLARTSHEFRTPLNALMASHSYNRRYFHKEKTAMKKM